MGVRASVLISGRGSNLESLIHKASTYAIASVFCDNNTASGLRIADEAEVRTQTFSRDRFTTKKDFIDAIMQAVEGDEPELILLAGFMRVIPEWFVQKHSGKILNIHPALLPKFPGLHTHERALEAREATHGCTVHFVDAGVDSGPIIAQASCEVRSDDDVASLAARVLAREHALYPWVVNHVAAGNITLKNNRVMCADVCANEASLLGFSLCGALEVTK